MARSAQTNARIRRKITKLQGEGYAPRQATAIAMRMYRDGDLPAPRKRKSRTQRQKMRRPSRRK